MLAYAILAATLLAAGYLLHLWLESRRREASASARSPRKSGQAASPSSAPSARVSGAAAGRAPEKQEGRAPERPAEKAASGAAPVPELASPAVRAAREGASAPPAAQSERARRAGGANRTIQISAIEFDEMVIDDNGTTLGVSASDMAGASRVSMQSDLDLSVEITITGNDDDEPSGPFVPVAVTVAGATDVGKKRKHNEDSIGIDEERSLYVLADGMGGYAAGEVASQMCVESILRAHRSGVFEGEAMPDLPVLGDELVRAIQAANREILTESRANEARAGMGTTVVASRFVPERQRVYIAHVGDSRLYRVRGEAMLQMTADHTLGALGVTGPSAQKLSRAVGVFDDVEVDLNIDVPEPGDTYLICSDGLFKMVQEARILEVVREAARAGDPPQATADALVAEANARGGKDNISVIVIRIAAVHPHDLRQAARA